MTKRSAFSVSAMALSLSLLTAGAAAAQDRQSAIDVLTDEIIVTATKKVNAENVQDIPIAITAFNADTLDALNVTDLESLSFSAPNVSLDDIGTSRGTANFSIRGLGINSSIPSIDPAVGVFVDGVYLGVNNAVVTDLFDLDSVEVLRGPQGLLFGRNTTGGAVLINTGNPTDEFEYKVRLATETPVDSGRGGLNSYAQAVISGPIVEGKLNGKVGGFYNNDDGYFVNLANGENFGKAETFIGRGALEFMPSDRVNFLLKAEYFDSNGQGPAAQNRGVFDRESFDFAIDNEGDYSTEAFTASLKTTIDVDFGDGQITNIFGYRNLDLTTDGDIDSLPALSSNPALPPFAFHSDTALEQDQISNELRYAGTFGNIDLTTGLYYFDQNVAYDEFRAVPVATLAPFAGGGSQDHTVYGAFAQVDYAISDSVTLIGGLRYSKEEKDGQVAFVIPRAERCSVIAGGCPLAIDDSDSWENLTPKVGLEFTPNDGLLTYATYTKGFRSGGYNFRITDPARLADQLEITGKPAFDEEKVDAFEVGFKSDFFDRIVQLNGAAFLTNIEDMQREVNLSDPGAGVSQFILNTADATIKGFEMDARVRIMDSLLMTMNVGVIDAEYDEVRFDISSDGLLNDADLALAIPRVPEATYGIGFIHSADLGDKGGLTSRINFQHRDEVAYTDNNFGWINPADMLDGNITWDTPVEGVSFSIFGKNLLDDVQAGGDTQVPFGAGLLGAFGTPLPTNGSNRGTGTNQPFADNPAVGTFSPLKKGRRIGIELTIRG